MDASTSDTIRLIVTSTTLILVAVISTVGSIIVARMGHKIQEIHMMVNSNLQAAKDERQHAIEALARLNERNTEILTTAVVAAVTKHDGDVLAETKKILET